MTHSYPREKWFVLTGGKDGLKLKIKYPNEGDLDYLQGYLFDRQDFLRNSNVEIVWEGEIPPSSFCKAVEECLRNLGANFSDPTLNEPEVERFKLEDVDSNLKEELRDTGLKFGTIDDANARLVFGTLRSGQKIEAPHSIILVGDANQGSEIISGGDVIVLGSLKGVAHAGAFDEDGGGRVIIALQLTPIQLRIGSVISRGEPSFVSVQKEPEIAFLQDGQIIVEFFDPKKFKTFKF